MKRHVWMPIAFFLTGTAFYVYYGITWNAWRHNLPNLAIYALICIALWWALKKRDKYRQERANQGV